MYPSENNAMKLIINSKQTSSENASSWRLNDTLQTDYQVKEEVKNASKEFLELNENVINAMKPRKTLSKPGVEFFSVKHIKTRKSTNKLYNDGTQ